MDLRDRLYYLALNPIRLMRYSEPNNPVSLFQNPLQKYHQDLKMG